MGYEYKSDELQVAREQESLWLLEHLESQTSLARHLLVAPSLVNGWVNVSDKDMPAFIIPSLPEYLRTPWLRRANTRSNFPLTGAIDTSLLNGSTREEVEGIMECLGLFVHMRKRPGSKARQQRIAWMNDLIEYARRALAEEEAA
ncbi:MAG: hypothetical protein IIA59_00460 [Candidatus Marinimicrobia bacterium]|nr:hypothetical protein [Candidatus Neomarinimicrobiota bacterium]